MESNSNQYSCTPQLRLILHTIWLFCISWWDCGGWMLTEVYLDFTALISIVHPHHLTARSLLAVSATFSGPDNTPESGIQLTAWWLVSSSDHARISIDPLQRVGGDHSLCYHNHSVQCSIAMSVKLGFSPVGQPMQMPGAAHWIPRPSELLPHGLLLWDWGLSHPLWA